MDVGGRSRDRHWVCARRMSDRRHQLGLTQCELVERLASVGVASTNRTMSAMEHGQGVDVGRLPEIAVALDCTITYLLGLTDDPQRWTPDSTQVEVIVDITTPVPDEERVSWILGPDVPARHA